MSEVVTVEEWLYGKMAGGVAGVANRVYSDVAPENATFPLIVFSRQSGHDNVILGGNRVLINDTWLVRVIGQVTGDVALETVADAIDTAINLQTGTGVIACYREEAFKMTEIIDGQQYRHLGGIYRILAQ